jgi:phage gpG-like protein
MRLDIDIKYDDDDAQELVDDIKRRGKDFRPVFRKIRDDLRSAFAKNFTSNGLEVGGWQPLDPGYAAWKSVHFPGAPPMVRTGKMFQSLATLRGGNNEIDRHHARFGTSGINYAEFHQYGTSKMPKREIVFIPQGAERTWSKMAVEYLAGGQEMIFDD